jgi:hypothetical protein
MSEQFYCECHLVEIDWCPVEMDKQLQRTLKHIAKKKLQAQQQNQTTTNL